MNDKERETLAQMTVAEIRHAQDICRAGIKAAYEKRATVALVKLQEWEQDYIDELVSRMEIEPHRTER